MFNKYRLKGAYHYDWYKTEPWYKACVDEIVDFCEGSTLDYGCGDAVVAKLISDKGYSVSGYDPDPDAIRLARENVPKVKFYQDLLPMTTHQYLASLNVIEHMDDPNVLREMLKGDFITDGAIIMTLEWQGGAFGEDHRKEYTLKELTKFFKEFNPKPFRVKEFPEWIGVKIKC